jgi:hypothetical protein
MALLGIGAAVLALAFTGSAKAADWCGPSGYSGGYGYSGSGYYGSPGYGYSGYGYQTYRPGHYDYVPGHYDRHRGHSDYVPSHVDYHIGKRRYEVIRDPYRPGASYIAPYPHRD